MRGSKAIVLAGALASGALTAGCGGTRQDAHEPSANFPVSIVRASFPTKQALAQKTPMTISVRNEGNQTVPDLAVTVNSFSYVNQQAGLADPNRPLWIVDQGPTGGQTAYTNTWALGPLAPGRVRTFTWYVTAVVPGVHRISYRVAAGLNGKARAQLRGGGTPQGSFTVKVSDQPPQARVDPNTGKVIASPPFPNVGGARSSSGSASSSSSSNPGGAGYGTQQPSDQQPGSGSGAQPDQGAGSAGGGSTPGR